EELDLAARQVARELAGPVETAADLGGDPGERVRHEPLGGQLRLAQGAAIDADADVQLAGDADRHQPTFAVEQADPRELPFLDPRRLGRDQLAQAARGTARRVPVVEELVALRL